MPELAEVLYFSRRWVPALDQKVLRVHLHDQKRVLRGVRTGPMRSTLRGQPLRAIQTHGKQMLFRFGTDRWLGVHLGMTGKLSAEPPDHLPGKHDHLVLYTRNRALVFQDPRLFGRIRFACSRQAPGWWSSLPTPVFSRKFSVPRLSEVLKKRGRTPLKPLLLLQEFFPGIGNWMADEILWQARLHPPHPGRHSGPASHRRTPHQNSKDIERGYPDDRTGLVGSTPDLAFPTSLEGRRKVPALPGTFAKATGGRKNHLLVPRLPEGGTSSPSKSVVI